MIEVILTIALRLSSMVVGVIDGIMSIFRFLHSAEQRLSESSRVGESPLDREARSWQKRVLDIWHWILLGLILIAALFGMATWLF